MIFGDRKKKRLLREGEEYLQILKRNRVYHEDLLPEKELAGLLELENRYEAALKAKDTKALEALNRENERLSRKHFPAAPLDAIRENVEVMIVAVVVALAIRTYFLQPFKIPTGSMQPTLFGVTAHPTTDPPPSWPMRLVGMILEGRSYANIVTESGGMISALTPGQWFLWFEYTDVTIGNETHRIWLSVNQVRSELGLTVGTSFSPGETVCSYWSDTGDQILVNKLTYHFRGPRRGEVFVFTTAHIPFIENQRHGEEGSQFYIKRCVGIPGDQLSINPPYLLNHGQIIEEPPIFQTIYARKDGYEGYDFGPGAAYLRPGESYTLEPDRYWAMGDNTHNSQDSRYFGYVPKQNLVGTALIVYWPFTNRWGLIH